MKEVQKIKPNGLFKNYIFKTIPLAFDESMSYYETLCGLLNYLKNTVIPAVDNNADAIIEVQNLMQQLQEYVDNYFDNLDVQEEINNKLDALVEDGTLTTLIGNYVNPIIDEFENSVNIRINALESGSPIPVSSINQMTDTSRVYVNTTNGYWYYYDGSDWVSGGIYQSTVASTEQYTRRMMKKFIDILNTLAEFKNIIPTMTFTDGYYYNTNGELTEYSSAKCTEINVQAGEMYYISGYNATSGNCYNILDANGVIETPAESGYNSYFIIIPDNAVTMQLNRITNRILSVQKVDSMQLNFTQINDILDMLSIEKQPVNLLKGVTLFNNKSYDNTGEIVDYNGFYASDKIEIPKNAKHLYFTTSKPTTLAILYDENQNFIAKISGIGTGGTDAPKTYDLTSHADAKYFAVTIWKNNPIEQIVTCDSLYEIVNEEDISNDVDLFMFMGQSNMTGQGNPSLAPTLIDGAGFEYSNSLNTIYPIIEPAGVNDNSSTNGSLITAFANSYYTVMKRPIIACMCAVSGSGIDEWQPNTTYLNRAITYLTNCKQYLHDFGYNVKNINMVWLQGEHEGANGSTGSYYKTMFNNMFNALKPHGIENCFIIRIGEYNGTNPNVNFSTIIQAQTEMCQDEENVIMASTTLASMKDRGQMNDQYHMNQIALNECGNYAGINSALYIRDKKEQTMYDYKYNDLYYSHKN